MTATIINTSDNMTSVSLPGDEKLRPADRSDASPTAQAVVRVRKNHMVLDFDKHHFEIHEAALIADGWSVIEDIRSTLR